MDRTVDPYRDTDVIDSWAPRANQSVVALVAILGVAFQWPLAWALMAAQLGVGLTFGRRFCLPCLAYFELIQPRIGEGPVEDSRPPRLANQMGLVFLGSAAVLWWLGAPVVGTVLGAMVAGLALLAATTGFCLGCEIYKLGAHLRGIRASRTLRIEPSDVGGLDSRAVVQFTHPWCSECIEWTERLAAGEEPVRTVDVRDRPDLARKYGVAVVPTVMSVEPDGRVVAQLAP